MLARHSNPDLTRFFDTPVPQTEDAETLLLWATSEFPGRIALATSLGPQTVIVLHLLHGLGRSVPTFVLDTGLLFPETYALWRTLEDRYGVRIEGVRSSLTIEDQSVREGERLWATDPDRCCALRKVHPLRRRLDGLGAWITGLRREPGSRTRGEVEPVSWDGVNGLFKVNPLWAWTSERVRAFARDEDIPLNPLLNRGYRSIGCTHCTARSTGADARSGRWVGAAKTECGLHFSTSVEDTDHD